MVKETEFYTRLGLTPNASESDIKKAYRKLAIKHHPDKGGNEDTFKKLTEAYEVLSNKDKREKYDNFGKDGLDNNGMNFNPQDIFNQFFGGMKKKKKKVSNIKHTTEISLKDVYFGKKIDIVYFRNDVCSDCDGKGSKSGKSYKCEDCNGKGIRFITKQIGPGMIQQMQINCNKCNGKGEEINNEDMCSKCNGNKVEKVKHTLPFKIPPGVPDNVQLSIGNEGHQDTETFERSDLVLIFKIKNSIFTRDENNLIYNLDLDIGEALCGCTKSFKHIDDEELCFDIDYKEQIKDGDIRIIENKGLPIFRHNNKFGDLIIKFNINYPPIEFIELNYKNITDIFKIKDNKFSGNKVILKSIKQKNFEQQHEQQENCKMQ